MTIRPALLALAFATSLALPTAGGAQTQADAFAGKIPPVSGQLYRKAGRLEATLTGNLSLNDAFFSKYFGGLKVGYHLTEFLSVSAQGAGGLARRTGSTVLCPTNDACREATDQQLYQVPGKLEWLVGLEVAWSPVYGKLNVLSEQVAHFDLSIFAGADLIAYRQALSSEAALALASGNPPTESAYGGHVGLGARLFLSEWMAVRLEVKDYLYRADVPNNGGKALQNQLFTELGLSFFLPGRNRPLR
jgi:outer membrane beta-barrel protein